MGIGVRMIALALCEREEVCKVEFLNYNGSVSIKIRLCYVLGADWNIHDATRCRMCLLISSTSGPSKTEPLKRIVKRLRKQKSTLSRCKSEAKGDMEAGCSPSSPDFEKLLAPTAEQKPGAFDT